MSVNSFNVGDNVRVVRPDYYRGSKGRVVVRRTDAVGELEWGVVFPWDIDQSPVYYRSQDLERINDE